MICLPAQPALWTTAETRPGWCVQCKYQVFFVFKPAIQTGLFGHLELVNCSWIRKTLGEPPNESSTAVTRREDKTRQAQLLSSVVWLDARQTEGLRTPDLTRWAEGMPGAQAVSEAALSVLHRVTRLRELCVFSVLGYITRPLHTTCTPQFLPRPPAVGSQLLPTATPRATHRRATTRVAGVVWCGLEKGRAPRSAALLTLGDCSSSITRRVEPVITAWLSLSLSFPVAPQWDLLCQIIPQQCLLHCALIVASIRWLFRRWKETETKPCLSFLAKLLTHGSIKMAIFAMSTCLWF